jgi:hypothetical protein
MVLDLLTNPDDFFRRRAADPGYLGPALVVLAVALVSALASVPILRGTLSAIPDSAGALVTAIQAFSVLVGVFVTFAQWLLYAGVLYAIAKVAFDGDGDFGPTFALVGWGFLPALFGAAVTAAVNFYAFSGVQFPENPQQTGRFVADLQSEPVFLVSGLLGVVFLLWSAFLWTFAVRHGQGLSLRSAAITVAVPTAFGLLLRLWGVFGGGLL